MVEVDKNYEVSLEGAESLYTSRINNKKAATQYHFTAEKAGKLWMVARSSSKDFDDGHRLVTLYDLYDETIGTAGICDTEVEGEDAPWVIVEIEFPEAGDYFFKIAKDEANGGTGAGAHIVDMRVYYKA